MQAGMNEIEVKQILGPARPGEEEVMVVILTFKATLSQPRNLATRRTRTPGTALG